MGLYKKLLEMQKAVVGLTRDKSGNSYQYVSGDKVLGIVRPKMDSLGLILVPEIEDSSFTRHDYTLVDNKGNARQKSEIFCALKLKFTWIDIDTGETLVCRWASSGQNNWDKGLGSALTYGERYFLLKFFHVATDKDDVDAPKSIDEELTLQQIIAQINGFTTQEQMNWAWNQYGGFWGKDKEFKAAFTKKQAEINKSTKK
ncbi:MAG: ERF family protein [Bacteroidales bacterium]|nr:ERF family protein [Bacteroidales bacterium]